MPIFPAADVNFEVSVPVAIIGAGAAGLTAALAARDAGAEVIVLERDALASGSTGLSSGMIPAAATRLQRAAGVDDNAEIFAGDIAAKAGGHVDRALVEAIAQASGPALDWLVHDLGIELTLVEGFLYPGHKRLRMHAPPSRRGAELIGALTRVAGEAEIEILTNALVDGLYADPSGRVQGLHITRPDGASEAIGCDAMVLACNGFGGNPDLVRHYIPEMSEANYFGHPGNRGDALLWGQELGARTRDLGSFQGHGSVAHPHGILISWALMTEGGIQVNAGGHRFCNEHDGYSEQARRVLAQEDGLAWNIYDQRLHRLGMEFEDYRQAEKLGAVRLADGAGQLAEILGLPADTLGRTIAECQQLAAGEGSDLLGRDFAAKPPLKPPYYGIQVTGALFHTQGGLVVDGAARVLDRAGQPLTNLFAAGGAAAGVSGPSDWGYLSGNGLLAAVTLGRLAGVSAARLTARETIL